MKNRFLKLGCLLLALLMMLTAFAACGSKEGEETQGVNTAVADDTEPVPHYDWGGRTFTVYAVNNGSEPNFEIVGEVGGERISDDVYKRNIWIEEYYNVKIEQIQGTADNSNTEMVESLKNSISSGLNPYDLSFLIKDQMSNAIVAGYMADLTTLPYLNFENDWYNQNSLETMKVGGRLFHMVSDFSLVDKARTNVLFFNRDLAQKNQLPDIIQMVREGSWTIEQMLTYAKAEDLDGDGTMELTDQWGLTCGGKEAAAAWWIGLENSLVSFDENGQWHVGVATEHSVNSIDKLRQLFAENVSFVGNRFGSYSDPSDVFVDQRTLFSSEILSGIEGLGAKATFAYAPLPYPKFDAEQQTYYTVNDNTFCATFGVPRCAVDADFSAFMIEVLSWRSSTTTFPAYYEATCKLQKSYDPVCAEMLDVVFESLIYDFGLVNNKQISLRSKILIESIYTTKDVTGLYKGVESATLTKIENLFNGIAALD